MSSQNNLQTPHLQAIPLLMTFTTNIHNVFIYSYKRSLSKLAISQKLGHGTAYSVMFMVLHLVFFSYLETIAIVT